MSFMSKLRGGNSTGLSRLAISALQSPPAVKAFSEMGVSGTAVTGGYVRQREKSPKWTGERKYITSAEIATNVSIVAAGIHHFLNLIARPSWNVRPVDDDDAQAVEMAEFVEEVIGSTASPWERIVRRSGMYLYHGFYVGEWTAERRSDGTIGLRDIEPRPQHTIKQWLIPDNGAVKGVVQESPQTGELLVLPRGKLVYLVDDTLTDSPEGLGIFRHIGPHYERLQTYYTLETVAFERDLRGIPVGRIPYTVLNKAVEDGLISADEAKELAKSVENFVATQVKQPNTSLTLDSMPYESEAQDGRKIASVMQWGVELLQGSSNGVEHVGAAIDRTLHEIARIMAAEHLMMGESSGNRALSEDKSRNIYLLGNSVLRYIAATFEKDVIDPLWALNGLPDDLKPTFEPEDVAFKDAEAVARILKDMSAAGAVLAPNDPVINDVRELVGVSPQEELDPEVVASMMAPAPTDEEIAADDDVQDEPPVEKRRVRRVRREDLAPS